MLSLCATPIGNMEDITLRVLIALREADEIWCEDTRHSRLLLDRYEIRKPLIACHMHNERTRAEQLIPLLQAGRHICYISDAGMPGISDPGALLVETCIREGLQYEVLPGASAALMSIVYAGMAEAGRFTFLGFLPRGGKERSRMIADIAACTHPVILYESPHRVRGTLEDIRSALGDMQGCLLRELTKKFECASRGMLSELIELCAAEPKGECVLIVDPSTRLNAPDEVPSPESLARDALSRGLSCRDAATEVAALAGIARREAYELVQRIRDEQV